MSSQVHKMSNLEYRFMLLSFDVLDFISPYVGKRARKFGIGEGMTVVDYGCGPGRYTVHLAQIVGDEGKVYALDIHEMAIAAMQKRLAQRHLTNVEPRLISGYDSGLPDRVADVVCAIDMFFAIRHPTELLREFHRITKPGGALVIDSGHEPMRATKQKILDSGYWDVVEETSDHLKCKPK
jgi:ubiquinone/menaquinone biosynthesis C-methylase UbiE